MIRGIQCSHQVFIKSLALLCQLYVNMHNMKTTLKKLSFKLVKWHIRTLEDHIEFYRVYLLVSRISLNSIFLLLSGTSMNNTLIVPREPFKLPRRNLVIIAIQKLVLRPNSVLNTTLNSNNNCYQYEWINWRCTVEGKREAGNNEMKRY